MRRLRLSFIALVLLLAACGRPSDEVAVSTVLRETAKLMHSTPVSVSAARAMAHPLRPPVDRLPPLPFAEKPLRGGSALQDSSHTGADSFAVGGGATNLGQSKMLTNTPGSISWVVYKFPGLTGSDTLKKLSVSVSNGIFAGSDSGYWIGIADFSANRWEPLVSAQDDYVRLLAANKTYVSPTGNTYVFLLLTGAQSVTIDSVVLNYDQGALSPWTEVTLASGNAGWTPAVAQDWYGDAWLAWSDHATGFANYAFGLATADLSSTANWELGAIDSQPTGKAQWTDLTIDQRTQLPVASLNYVEQTLDAQNSQAGFSPFIIGAQSQRMWLNFSLGKMDGAQYTSIDFDPISSFFGMATVASNALSITQPPFALYVRYPFYNLSTHTLDSPMKSSLDLQGGWHFPHLRFSPAQQRTRVLVNGGTTRISDDAPGSGSYTWSVFNDVASTGPLGSLAYNPAAAGPRIGTTYSKDIGGQHTLFYGTYDSEAAVPNAEIVASLPIAGGSEWLGAASQLAYMYDGRPVIAYTVKQGSAVQIRFAYKTGAGWITEAVSTDQSDPGTTAQDVLVDLAVEPKDMALGFTHTDRIFVTWNDIAGTGSSLKAAFRTLPPG